MLPLLTGAWCWLALIEYSWGQYIRTAWSIMFVVRVTNPNGTQCEKTEKQFNGLIWNFHCVLAFVTKRSLFNYPVYGTELHIFAMCCMQQCSQITWIFIWCDLNIHEYYMNIHSWCVIHTFFVHGISSQSVQRLLLPVSISSSSGIQIS